MTMPVPAWVMRRPPDWAAVIKRPGTCRVPSYCAVPDRLDDCVPAESVTESVAVCTEPAASLPGGPNRTVIEHVWLGCSGLAR